MRPHITDRNQIDIKSLIMVWAFAESGIGGLLHAFKIPLTGIFVGGIATVCIAMISSFRTTKTDVLKALMIVLAVKLAVSPHSPWQAYVAVIFQGYLGYVIFYNLKHYKIKVLLFTILCLLESAVQKILIYYLIFGRRFFNAVDEAAASIISNFNSNLVDLSLSKSIFFVYIAIHLLIGIILGYWVPKLPLQISQFKELLPPQIFDTQIKSTSNTRKFGWLIGLFSFLVILVIIRFLIPDIQWINIFDILFRSIIITVILVLVMSPIVRYIISRWTNKRNQDTASQILFTSISNQLPQFVINARKVSIWIHHNYEGFNKIKYLILSWFALSIIMDEKK